MRALRPSGKRPYAIVVAPVSRRYPVLSVLRPAVCIMITDPDERRPLPSHRVQAAFGLTEAEARLASLLASGAELRSAAAELKITYGTARARLAEIFQKTETRREGELIKLLLTTLAIQGAGSASSVTYRLILIVVPKAKACFSISETVRCLEASKTPDQGQE